MPANISSKDDLQRLVDETRKAFGQIDILVCNAASNPYYGPMSGIPDDAFRKILDNNIVSNNWLINMVAPEMKERRDGSIIIVSSVGGLREEMTTLAPCSAMRSAIALPIPLVEPVITATLPFRSNNSMAHLRKTLV